MGTLDHLQDFFRETYHAHLLMASTTDHRPGMLLDVHRWIFPALPIDSRPVLGVTDGYGWSWTGEDPSVYPVEDPEPFMIPSGPIRDAWSIEGAIGLPQIGLSLGGSLSTKIEFEIQVSGLAERNFVSGRSFIDMRNRLVGLRDSNPTYYKAVKDDFLIKQTYHASELLITFRHSGGTTAKVALEQAGLKYEASLKYAWSGDTELRISGLPEAPFAVHGRRVRYWCFMTECNY